VLCLARERQSDEEQGKRKGGTQPREDIAKPPCGRRTHAGHRIRRKQSTILDSSQD